MRKQLKGDKKDEKKDGEGSTGGTKSEGRSTPEGSEELNPSIRDGNGGLSGNPAVLQKKRRGRPPGLNNSGKSKGKKNALIQPKADNGEGGEQTVGTNGDDDLDIMGDLSSTKALQMNVVLHEINRKVASTTWNP